MSSLCLEKAMQDGKIALHLYCFNYSISCITVNLAQLHKNFGTPLQEYQFTVMSQYVGLSLSFDSTLVLIFTLITNLFLYAGLEINKLIKSPFGD